MAEGTPNCPSCGARVEGAPGEQAYVYTCRFCGAHVPIAPLVKARDPRADLVKAALELRAEREREAGAAIAATKTAGKSVGCIILVSTLVPILIPVGIFVIPWASKVIAAKWGSFPITVGTNESLEISDRDVTGTDLLVTVGVNGKLTLRRCHLKAPQIVKAGTNAQITIIDSTLEGQRGIVEGDVNVVLDIQNSTLTSGEEIADVQANAKISVSKGSHLQSASVAFPLENNAEITVDHSEVDGKLGVFELKNNGRVKLLDSAVVKSDGPAIDLTQNGHLDVKGSRIESKTTAVHAVGNLEGTLRAATLIGPRMALDVGSNAHLTVAQSSVQGGRKLGSNSTIEDR
jgi:predicted RNA-binding Zn-ribbon protein involved in translation (DUF1610 family)